MQQSAQSVQPRRLCARQALRSGQRPARNIRLSQSRGRTTGVSASTSKLGASMHYPAFPAGKLHVCRIAEAMRSPSQHIVSFC